MRKKQNMHRLSDANTVSTPADLRVKLKKEDGLSKDIDSTVYQSMIGSILYATHPDKILHLQWEWYPDTQVRPT